MNIFNIVVSILIFGVLIIIHELGHFVAARLSGVKVLEFAIGMGPQILAREGKETKLTLRAIPVGGFCKMQGEDQADYSKDSFNSKSALSRIFILLAGSLMNILGAVSLLTLIFFMIGTPTTIVDTVETGFPAYEQGILPGDKIIEINGTEIESWESINEIIDDSVKQSYEIEVLRDGEPVTISLESKYDEELDRYRIGITRKSEKNIIDSIVQGFKQTFLYFKLIITTVVQLFTGRTPASDLIGPIGVVGVVGETVRYGALAILNIAAIISLNLAVFNLLPIPALDGSRIIFIIIEKIKGSPVDPEKEGMIHLIGFAVLMALALLVAYNDILRLK